MSVFRIPFLAVVIAVAAVGFAGADSSHAVGSGRIAFVRGGDIYTISPTGFFETQITTIGGVAGGVDWSPDGSKIAFGRGNDLWVVDADGSNLVQLTSTAQEEENPSWSPDGTRISFGYGFYPNMDVAFIDVNTLALTVLPTGPTTDFRPSWSPDGSVIAYSRNDNPGPNQNLWFINVDGTNNHQCLPLGGGNPDWSPDGSQLTYSAGAGPAADTYRIDVVDTVGLPCAANITQLTTAPGEDILASWSGDGTEIAYSSQQNGPIELFKMNADGSNKQFIASGSGGGLDWSPIVPVGGAVDVVVGSGSGETAPWYLLAAAALMALAVAGGSLVSRRLGSPTTE